jgi:hypothetical protein
MVEPNGDAWKRDGGVAQLSRDLVPWALGFASKFLSPRVTQRWIVDARRASWAPSGPLWTPQVRIWAVFILCYLCGVVGVLASLSLFGSTIASTGGRLLVSCVIALVMLSLSYRSKYSHNDSRGEFSPEDLLSFFVQGLFWPTTWPTLAKFLGVVVIEGPKGS